VPKVEGVDDVRVVDWYLTALETEGDLEPGSVKLMPTIESVAGLAAVEQIAAASPRIDCLVFGAGDFSLDAGLDWPQPDGMSELLLAAKRRIVLASRLAGLAPPHDGAYPMFRDDEGLRAEAEQARLLGMFGKHAIHPRQLAVIDQVFRPTSAQVAHARSIVAAFETSEAAGVGNLDLAGQFIDYPVVERARQLLALADELGTEVEGA
jgi:citrate lyase subunit beta/citryl-CoA lyase